MRKLGTLVNWTCIIAVAVLAISLFLIIVARPQRNDLGAQYAAYQALEEKYGKLAAKAECNITSITYIQGRPETLYTCNFKYNGHTGQIQMDYNQNDRTFSVSELKEGP